MYTIISQKKMYMFLMSLGSTPEIVIALGSTPFKDKAFPDPIKELIGIQPPHKYNLLGLSPPKMGLGEQGFRNQPPEEAGLSSSPPGPIKIWLGVKFGSNFNCSEVRGFMSHDGCCHQVEGG